MYSDKKNVLQLVALLKAHGIRHIVLSPGSRNAPLIHSFAGDGDFTCYSVVDERSAGYLRWVLYRRLIFRLLYVALLVRLHSTWALL